MPPNIKHILRYGTHAEKDFFLGDYSRDYYDAVMLNGNMVAYSIGAMSTFVLSLRSPFFIDPQTHAFQHDVEHLLGKNGQPKISLLKLANFLGEPFKTALASKESVGLSALEGVEARDRVVEAACKFQISSISEKLASQEEADYVKFALHDEDSTLTEDHLMPVAVVAPYFFIADSASEDWLNLNTDLVERTNTYIMANHATMPVLAQVVISKETLRDNDKRARIISAYSALNVAGIMLWVDGLAEDEIAENDLKLFQEIVTAFKEGGKSVFNLYGGYFSILLTKLANGLDGVCHGLEYGESRPVVPVGGGVPISKYYFPPLHKRLKYADLISFLRKKGWDNRGAGNPEFASNVCDCESCYDLAKYGEAKDGKPDKRGIRRAYPTIEAKEHSLKHYLRTKAYEFTHVETTEIAILANELQSGHDEYLSTLGENNVDHLLRWKSILLSSAGRRVDLAEL